MRLGRAGLAPKILAVAAVFVALAPSPSQGFLSNTIAHTSAGPSSLQLYSMMPPVEFQKVELSSGTLAEIATCSPPPGAAAADGKRKPPLAFVHGSFHAAWCWAEQYLPFFASRGYPAAALSLRGTGGTPAPEGVKKIKIDQHVDDVEAFLEYVRDNNNDDGGADPVLIAHSFGGLSAMKKLERAEGGGSAPVSGIVLLCSVPPSGIMRMSTRSLRRTPLKALRTTAGLAMKRATTSPSLCRSVFFDDALPDEDVERYRMNFQRDSAATIDLSDLSRRLPSACADGDGRASFASTLPPVLVMGATEDAIVDLEGVQETARFFGVMEKMVESPHDMMLGRRWQEGADAILLWQREEVETRRP